MNFLFPTFLIGLLAIVIPIIIHLFNFRKYKKVYFTNVQFLKELKQESDSKSKLKELLILAMRVLAIACLVFAFAQPFIPGKTKSFAGEKAVSIYIDNSFSMESINKKGTLLENAKDNAVDIVNTFSANDKFQLLTNDFEGKHQRFLSKEEFLDQLNQVKISSATKQINDVLKRQKDFLQNSSSKNKCIFLLSDFQKNAAVFNKSDIDTTMDIRFIPLVCSEISNIYIDSVWFESPVQQFGTQQTIHAVVVNKSDKEIENGSIKLFINNSQVSLSVFNVNAHSKTEVSISFSVKINGINKGVLKIEDYPIVYDDEFYFSFNSKTIINALVINGKESKTGNYFKALMQNDSLFLYSENNELAIEYSKFETSHIIILNELVSLTSGLINELQKFISKGGSVVIFPSQKSDISFYNAGFQALQLPHIIKLDTADTKVQNINFEQGFYQGVFDKIDQRMDLPKVFEYFEFNKITSSNSQTLLFLQNGQPLLSLSKIASGKIYLFSIPTDQRCSNLLKHALFVPTLIRISILSINPSSISYKTSSNEAISLTTLSNFSDEPLHVVKDDKKIDIIPEHRLLNNSVTLFTQNQITEAGYYAVFQNEASIKDLAFNFDRKESDMTFMSEDDLQNQIDKYGLKNIEIINPNKKTLANAIQEINGGKNLWKLFLILTLIFLALEILIIRLYKN